MGREPDRKRKSEWVSNDDSPLHILSVVRGCDSPPKWKILLRPHTHTDTQSDRKKLAPEGGSSVFAPHTNKPTTGGCQL